MSDIRDSDKLLAPSDWHREIVDDLKICRAQAFQARRDALPHHDEGLTDETWIGPLAEEVFDRWLTARGIDHDWDHDPDRFDDVEFYIAPRNVDVKCMNQNADCEPLGTYACNVKKWQAEKPDSRVTDYVFARYIVPTREVIIFGGMTRAEFREKAVPQEKNKQVTDSFKVSETLLEVYIEDLTPTEELLAGRTCLGCGHWNGFMEGQLCGPCWMARRALAKREEAR